MHACSALMQDTAPPPCMRVLLCRALSAELLLLQHSRTRMHARNAVSAEHSPASPRLLEALSASTYEAFSALRY
jgi:hypothetical protein